MAAAEVGKAVEVTSMTVDEAALVPVVKTNSMVTKPSMNRIWKVSNYMDRKIKKRHFMDIDYFLLLMIVCRRW